MFSSPTKREHAVHAPRVALQQARQKATSGGSQAGAVPDAVLPMKVLQVSRGNDVVG